MSHSNESSKVVLFALLANLGIAIAKFVGAAISGSTSMLAEAIHSLVDTTNQVLLMVGAKRAQKAPDDLHPLGYSREAFFWSFVVAILLFSLGGLFAIYEGAHKIHNHEPLSSPVLTVGILIFSVVLEGMSFRACLKEVRAQNTHGSLWAWYHKSTAADLLVVFTEDLAAMIGLTLATGFVLLSWATGNPLWDAIGSIVVGAVLVIVAVLLASEIKSLIIGEAPATDFKTFLEIEIAKQIPNGKLLRLVAIQIGVQEVMLSYKIDPGSVVDVASLISLINSIEREMRKKFPQIRWQFVEPDTEA